MCIINSAKYIYYHFFIFCAISADIIACTAMPFLSYSLKTYTNMPFYPLFITIHRRYHHFPTGQCPEERFRRVLLASGLAGSAATCFIIDGTKSRAFQWDNITCGSEKVQNCKIFVDKLLSAW